MKKISISALAWACHAVIWFVTAATIAAERSPAFKEFLAGLSGHHWTAKGGIALVLFFAVAGVLSRKKDPQDVSGLVRGVLISAVLGALAILVFYLLHNAGMA